MQVYSPRFSLWAVARRQATEKTSVEFMLWKPFVRRWVASGKGIRTPLARLLLDKFRLAHSLSL